jgi:hypothetical protein
MLTWRIRFFDKFAIYIHRFCCSFGLLENCAHSFCLSCIREWRASADAVRTEAVRACPICRVESHFVVPWHVLLHAPFPTIFCCSRCHSRLVAFRVLLFCCSDRFVSEPARKAAIVEEFRTATARIPCKHFNAGRGECPFGTSCFYAHVMPVRPNFCFPRSVASTRSHVFFHACFSRRQDGRPDVPAAPRFMADDEGNVSSIRKIVLADFIGL